MIQSYYDVNNQRMHWAKVPLRLRPSVVFCHEESRAKKILGKCIKQKRHQTLRKHRETDHQQPS